MKELVEKKRQEMIQQFLSAWFLFGGMISSDTYKRTMWKSEEGVEYPDDEICGMPASYHLTLRKGLPETGANNRLVMAGHEWMLRQWFLKPLKRADIELAIYWYTNLTKVKSFPVKLFKRLLAEQTGDDIYLPIDVWGFPGGQTFLAGVPCLSFEGVGGITSFVEPHVCRYFSPIIHATKGRLMHEVAGNRHAEFGYRSDQIDALSVAKLLAIFVGNGVSKILTSCDVARLMFPEYFDDIGTIGHEYACIFQTLECNLDDADLQSMEAFVAKHEAASLLPDLIDATTVGLRNVVTVIKKNPSKPNINARIDSGEIAKICILYYERMMTENISMRTIVFEDEVSPDKVRDVYDEFRKTTGVEPVMLFPGAGGYYNRLLHRDTVSAAFKRSMTNGNPNIKFSNSEGKESIPGTIRVYGRGRTLYVADVSENVDGNPLYQKLVSDGKIVNPEDMNFHIQAGRSSETWNQYDSFEHSPLIQEWFRIYRAKRAEAQKRAREAL